MWSQFFDPLLSHIDAGGCSCQCKKARNFRHIVHHIKPIVAFVKCPRRVEMETSSYLQH